MGIAVYSIKRLGDQWAVEHDGKIEGDGYISKESAFEAIMALHPFAYGMATT